MLPAKAKKKVTRDLRKAGVTPANVTEELRTKNAPIAFVAEPAPNSSSPSPERTKKLSPWLQHVMKDNNCSLKEAMKLASKSYN